MVFRGDLGPPGPLANYLKFCVPLIYINIELLENSWVVGKGARGSEVHPNLTQVFGSDHTFLMKKRRKSTFTSADSREYNARSIVYS